MRDFILYCLGIGFTLLGFISLIGERCKLFSIFKKSAPNQDTVPQTAKTDSTNAVVQSVPSQSCDHHIEVHIPDYQDCLDTCTSIHTNNYPSDRKTLYKRTAIRLVNVSGSDSSVSPHVNDVYITFVYDTRQSYISPDIRETNLWLFDCVYPFTDTFLDSFRTKFQFNGKLKFKFVFIADKHTKTYETLKASSGGQSGWEVVSPEERNKSNNEI